MSAATLDLSAIPAPHADGDDNDNSGGGSDYGRLVAVLPPSPPSCGSCSHWVRRPTDPNNLATAANPTGECRAIPPQLIMVGPGAVMASYPTLPEMFPCCGQYEPRRPDRIAAIMPRLDPRNDDNRYDGDCGDPNYQEAA